MSFTASCWPICEPDGSRYVVDAPWSAAATSNAQRVRVEVFSKISAMFLPRRCCVSAPAFLAALSSAASSIRPRNSSSVKSSSLRKWRPARAGPALVAMGALQGCENGDEQRGRVEVYTMLHISIRALFVDPGTAHLQGCGELRHQPSPTRTRDHTPTAALSTGQLIHRGAPRPRPSSLPGISITSMPCFRRCVLVVTFRS